jgi:lipopolysaccharide/colanic/teichoic acid biosynthesis glycosyltransferase
MNQVGSTLGERSLSAPRQSLAWSKRGLDVVLAVTGLILSAPLWLLIALAVKWQDRGPIFFRDRRVGQGGRVFEVIKFRTMIPDADRHFGPRQASEKDLRVTPVGHVLRATALDELPQLWSIFRGHMSFVGPRALRPGEVQVRGGEHMVMIENVPGFAERHACPPGLTGVAQIYGDRDLPPHHKFRYDLFYIRNQSFCFDVRLILLSFWITLRGTWERRGKKW